MGHQRIRVAVTTDASGDFSEETPHIAGGRLVTVRYVPAASNDLDANWDLDIVGTTTGIVVANEDNISAAAFTRHYRQPTHDTTGAASLYAGGGEPVESDIWIIGESLTVTVADGGNVQSGTLYLLFADA